MANGQATLTTYNYDNLGRFVLSQSTAGITTTYVYSTDSMFETQIDSAIPAYSYTKHFALNSSGLAVKDPAGDIYTYDATGHLVNDTRRGDTLNNTWQNGNLVMSVTHDIGFTGSQTHFYSSALETRDVGSDVWGKRSVNLDSLEVDIDNGDTIRYLNTYQLDNQSRVVQWIQTGAASTFTVTYTYY